MPKLLDPDRLVITPSPERVNDNDPESDPLYHSMRYAGGEAVFQFAPSSSLVHVVLDTLRESEGFHAAERYGGRFPFSVLVKHWDAIRRAALDDYSIPLPRSLDELIGERVEQLRAQLALKIERGELEFEDLKYYFKNGQNVIIKVHGEWIAGRLETIEVGFSLWSGPYADVKINVIARTRSGVGNTSFSTRFGGWDGLLPISDVPLRLITDEERTLLTERGRRYVEYVSQPACYLEYTGHVTRVSWYGNKTYRADGRVMLDTESFGRIDSEQFREQQRSSGVEDKSEREAVVTVNSQINVVDEDLWRCYPFVVGFSFSAKQWGRLNVSGLRPIAWRDEAFRQLVLDDETKTIVRSLVEHQEGSFQDIIQGKGGGTIFLLHGPPGEGKTLTAEAIAELLRRPLYSVSIGELGVSPDELEDKLRVILEIATVWNAVILIDEADIFLEARTERDIVRNAMVGVFLRLLEYHQGVLFLTTNRVRNIDSAFYSRISVAIMFPVGTTEKRVSIWRNLLTAAKIQGLSPEQLGSHALNGRQIKNVIRQSQTLAHAEGVSVSKVHVERVITLTQRFQQELAAQQPTLWRRFMSWVRPGR